MKSLTVKLKNCYGIGSFDHEFSFDSSGANIVYAPNGVMKTSLAKTFLKLSKGERPEEKLFNKVSEYEIKLDAEDITPEEILVVQPFDKSYESKNISTLLVNSAKKSIYDAAYKEILEAKQALVIRLNKISKIKKEDIEAHLSRDFACQNIFDALKELRALGKGSADYAKIPYTTIFDPKVLELLQDGTVLSGIKEYTERYNELIESSPLFSKGKFNPTNAVTVSKALKKERFFEASHKVVLNGKDKPVVDQKEFDSLFEQESAAIFGDGSLKEISKKIIDGVASVKSFQDILESTPQLAADLSDLPSLRQFFWGSYYLEDKVHFDRLLDVFYQGKDELAQIEMQAQLEDTLWHEAKDVFKARFHVPFDIDIENHKNAILGTTAPNMVFTFKGEDGTPIVFNRGQLDSLDCLSVGERRAMYLLYVIFEFKARLHSGKRTIIIVDDIADSFDYKNKYAIIEYLKELAEEPLLRLVVLTHNFDFYRTFQSRIIGEGAKRSNSFVAQRYGDCIKLVSGGSKNVTNPFDLWKKEFAHNPAVLVSMIPFVRNLIEYKDGSTSEPYKILTSMLHVKQDTMKLKLSDLEVAISEVIKRQPLSDEFDKDQLVIDLIYTTAANLSKKTIDESLALENKIALSIAIRLKAEEFMWQHVENQNDINGNQTGKLFDRLCKENIGLDNGFSSIRKILSQVVLMTPENIHLNSFMYEPLMDISTHHLVDLFQSIGSLKWVAKGMA